jgi:PAS domain S-box-containing protein
MKLSTKLILSFSVVVLLVGGIGLASSYVTKSVKDEVITESKHAIEEIQLAGQMGMQLYHSFTKIQYLLEDGYRQSISANLSRSNLSYDAVIAIIDSSHRHFRKSVSQMRALIEKDYSLFFESQSGSSNIAAQLENLEKKFNIYVSLVEQLQVLSREDNRDGKEFFTVTIEPYVRTTLLPLIEEVQKAIQLNHQAKIATLNTQLTEVGRWLGIATIISLIIAVSLTFFLYRSIANPLENLARAAQNIARGNLNDRIDYHSNNELGQLSKTFNHMAESLSRTTVSRDYVDSIIESMADLLIVTDQEYKITRVNSAGLLMMNRSEEEVLGRRAHFIFKNDQQAIFGDSSNKKLELVKGNTVIKKRGGADIPVSASKGKIKGRNDEVKGFVIVASDISSEKEAQQKIVQSLKEKEILLAEIHHRVKNNLAVISGLLQMQIWEAENEFAATALQESQLRVQSIALVHEKLYQSESLSYIRFDKYIQELLQAVSSTYLSQNSDIKIITNLESIVLNINQAIPCSLLLNELVSNALKHAFSEQGDGCIEISMTQSGNQIELKVKDDGKGFPNTKTDSKSMGMSLVDTLCKQIDGQLEFENKSGAIVTVKFEREEVTAA